ncbi:class I SAM-dependent methyltransferase [Azospirillum sp. sgz301742]
MPAFCGHPLAYHDQVNPDLLDAIPAAATRILEVGCGTGALGQALKARTPQAHCTGLELNPEAAMVARQRLDRVVEGDAEDDSVLAQIDGGSFDAVVFGDVLEHLIDPARLLTRLHRVTRADAVVIACIPNVQHWSVLTALLGGHWDYTDGGILDRTHLRFFTLDSGLDLFMRAGWQPADVRGRIFDREDGMRFADTLRPAVQAMGIDPDGFAEGVLPLQYIILAEKIPAT